jgi:hypothetical protein
MFSILCCQRFDFFGKTLRLNHAAESVALHDAAFSTFLKKTKGIRVPAGLAQKKLPVRIGIRES